MNLFNLQPITLHVLQKYINFIYFKYMQVLIYKVYKNYQNNIIVYRYIIKKIYK